MQTDGGIMMMILLCTVSGVMLVVVGVSLYHDWQKMRQTQDEIDKNPPRFIG